MGTIEHAMIAAIESAGFVNAHTERFAHAEEMGVCVSGDCPCGRGTSRFAVLFSVPPDPARVYDAIRAQAQAHIEHDRARGRWA